jgi:nicotinamide-nucleotide amidase
MLLEVVTIGDELLLGFTVDTNAAYISKVLAAEGMEVVRKTTVGDSADAIASAVGDALTRTGAVITTGGLGPTSDDATKSSIASLMGREMREDPGILAALGERWRSRGLPMPLPLSNANQAQVPDGAEILINDFGTAPGIWIQDGRGWVAMLPGVPREMRGMLVSGLLPRLRKLGSPDSRGVIRSLTLRTTGIPESAIADRIEAAKPVLNGASLAYLPGVEGVDLRLTLHARSAGHADELLSDAAAKLRPTLGSYMYGEDDSDLAAIVLDLCRTRKARLATAESCTGGMLGSRITAVPGSSDCYVGGMVLYANSAKIQLAGVPESLVRMNGAVSEQVATAMAGSVRDGLGADLGVGVTGVAGPGGGTPEKPVGTVWIASGTSERMEARSFRFPGDREEIRQRATQAALDMVRQLLTS